MILLPLRRKGVLPIEYKLGNHKATHAIMGGFFHGVNKSDSKKSLFIWR